MKLDWWFSFPRSEAVIICSMVLQSRAVRRGIPWKPARLWRSMLRGSRMLCVAVLTALTTVPCISLAGGLTWRVDYGQAKAEAGESRRNLCVFFRDPMRDPPLGQLDAALANWKRRRISRNVSCLRIYRSRRPWSGTDCRNVCWSIRHLPS